jgi:hypothetical protein
MRMVSVWVLFGLLEITRRQLRKCHIKYGIDKIHKASMDKYEAVCRRLEESHEHCKS